MLSYLACKNRVQTTNQIINGLNQELLVPIGCINTEFCIGWAEKGLSGVVLS